MRYVEIIMVLVYVLVGAGVASGYFDRSIPPRYALPVGLVIIAYGLFRASRVYTKYVRK